MCICTMMHRRSIGDACKICARAAPNRACAERVQRDEGCRCRCRDCDWYRLLEALESLPSRVGRQRPGGSVPLQRNPSGYKLGAAAPARCCTCRACIAKTGTSKGAIARGRSVSLAASMSCDHNEPSGVRTGTSKEAIARSRSGSSTIDMLVEKVEMLSSGIPCARWR